MRVEVADPPGVSMMLVGAIDAPIPVGERFVRDTLSLNQAVLVALIVDVLEDPAETVIVVLLSEIEKSGRSITDTIRDVTPIVPMKSVAARWTL